MSPVESFFSLVGLFGWLFCSGNVLVSRIPIFSKNPPMWLIGSVSFIFSAAVLAFLSPLFPFTTAVTTLIGLALVFLWVFLRPPLPQIVFPPDALKFFIPLVFIFFTAYAAVFIFTPEDSFDSLSYHLPFTNEFASSGQIGYPAQPMNWLEHVHYSYPHAIEMVFGLVHQTSAHLHNFFHFWLLILALAGLLHLAKSFHFTSPWSAVAFALATPTFFIFLKMFPVETGLFVGVLTLLTLLPLQSQHNNFSRVHLAILFLLGLFFGLSKLNTFSYVGAICLVSALFVRTRTNRIVSFIPLAGTLVGVGWFIAQSFLHGANFFTELNIAQALTFGLVVPVPDRISRIVSSFLNYPGFPFIFFGVGGALVLARFDKAIRPLALALVACVLFFAGVFTVTSLYINTYYSFGLYSFAFIGLSSLILARLFQLGYMHAHFFVRLTTILITLGIFVSGFYYVYLYGAVTIHGYSFDSSHYYPELVKVIPNDANTTIFFMNNINTLNIGFERVTMYDHTTFPRPEGDPCVFWRDHHITHIVYWAQGLPTFQLDGGNPSFYEDTLSAMRTNRCSILLYDGNIIGSPLFARVNP